MCGKGREGKETIENSQRTGKKQRGTGKPFSKGISGNPGGRPKTDPAVKEMFRAAAPGAVQLLIDTMNDPNVKIETRLKCADTVLERTLGKAAQPIDLEGASQLEIVLAPDLTELAK